MTDLGTVVAVVPVKSLAEAKGRLAEQLDAATRRELTAWMLERVTAACAGTPCVADVLVVAGDADGAAVAQRRGVRAVIQDEPGLAGALQLADARTASAGATLVVAADLPLATAADLQAVCEAAARGADVVVAPTWDGGTGVLLRRPAGVIPPAYGPGSANRHLAIAAAAGVSAVRAAIPNLALDVDTAAALRRAADHDPFLAEVASRLPRPATGR